MNIAPDDILNRLRWPFPHCDSDGDWLALCREAADEIERLRRQRRIGQPSIDPSWGDR